MDPNNEQMLHEILKLTRVNNEMLHRMRRAAFLSGLVKFIVYLAILLVPIWFYMTYLNGTVQTLLQDVNKIEGVNTQAQNQLQGLQSAWQQFQSRFGGSTTTAQ